jgi:predicted enzyme related to lactoylglutathione lyase
VELPPPRAIVYPGEAWLAMHVADVNATCRSVAEMGGKVIRAGQDRPEHSVRAAVVADPEGHIIELVGPMLGA